MITPDLAVALDRNRVSDRAALMIVGETAKCLGQDIESLVLNTGRGKKTSHISLFEKINKKS